MLSVRYLSRLLVGLVLAAALVVPVHSARAGGGAQTVQFLDLPSGNCNIGATGGTPTRDFAVIVFPRNGTVSATVVVRGAAPNATYEVTLVQIPNDGCGAPQAFITTDSLGDGSVHVAAPLLPGTTSAFALLFSGFDLQATPAAPLQ